MRCRPRLFVQCLKSAEALADGSESRLVRNINLEARDGDRIALVGDYSSGKSTLPMLFRGSIHRLTAPSRLSGNVSPMFDATLGISMDATGLENIQIAGTIWA
jgi:lipopolysaccharide transport system ATP-binding protein